ncbi:MAG: GNAT family N-acetyltransferase [Alphaproteobacteria bacterium]|nr:MAG: GNAT family N-acetyltransferase [Alphaproteobacteria bacterium]
MSAELRATHVADMFRLQEIERAASELFRGSNLIDIDAMAVASLGEHETSIQQGLSFVAEVEGRIAGFVIGEMHFDDAYLHELDVDPAYGQRGIGVELVRRFVSGARAKNAKAVYLSTFREPKWNAPFYRKLGFVDVARGDYLRWMSAMETEQAKFLDVSTRVFMRLGL